MTPAPFPTECDVLVCGSGAGGFTAALAAALHGLDVVLIEKDIQLGGTSAFSGGVGWAPGNAALMAAGRGESRERALAYIRDQAGALYDAARAEAFVDTVPAMERFFAERTDVAFTTALHFPDYHPSAPGGMDGGRSLWAASIDGRTLGPDFALVRPTYPTMMLWGGLMLEREDIHHLTHALRSPRSAWAAAKLVAGYWADRLRYGRGTRLTGGNALIARMLLSARRAGLAIHPATPMMELVVRDGAASGAIVEHLGARRTIRARRGVVLATGGFAWAMDRDRFYGARAGRIRHNLLADGNSGDGLHAAEALGARICTDRAQPAAWAPISLVPRPDGSGTPYPHFIDRAKPGVIAVDRRGRRFVNEARSYHDFVQGMFAACSGDGEIMAWLVCDHRAFRAYGLGVAPPRPGNAARHVRSGYVRKAGSLEDLAGALGMDAAGLAATVAAYNVGAQEGNDAQFGRGGDAFQRMGGDPAWQPNPCVAPIGPGPFYAIKVFPADLGSFNGLATDADARVLDRAGEPIGGLYAVGGDAASLFGGEYLGGGSMIGPAMVFGYRAGLHLAGAGQPADQGSSGG